jgi:amino acid adenylation domain-containing protein/non-ribosomal peptide synthase protein (TIGR01720 family)
MYRTGDLARFLADGSIEFLGRMDRQVKIRGHRIEPGEIEAVLRQCPGIRDAAVVADQQPSGQQRLVAYFVHPETDAPTPEDLRGILQRKLPEYMIPAVFVRMDALPLTPNGKLDRRALPPPEAGAPATAYLAPRTPLEQRLAAMWADLLKVERVGVYDNFFELGGNSIQAAIFVNRLQEQFQTTAHVRSLFMAPTVAELARYINEYYPEAVAKLCGDGGGAGEFGFQREIAAGDRVDAAKVARIRSIIPALPPRADSTPRNPRALFVLSPPRSGSTLLRAMLAGHPRLFSPPELDLLSFNTLQERRAAFEGKYAFWLEGPIRAIMEITGCDAEQATRLMEEFEGRNLTTKAFYRQLQEWIGDRLLVDKTPVYPLDLEILKRAEHDFEGALYIHLTRHPYASIYSFIEAKLDGVFFRYRHPFSPRELAELVWIVSHQNILEFLRGIPSVRQHRIRYEDLVARPREVMEGICQFAGIDFVPAMLEPYRGRRMTDGVRPGAQMVGDFKFYLRKNIDAKAAGRWKKFHNQEFLSDIAWDLAQGLGYEKEETESDAPRPVAQEPIPRVARGGELPLSFAQQRLWFLDHLEPGCPIYNVPAAVRLSGELDQAALVRSVQEIVRRHEVLRTRFTSKQGRAIQVIDAEAPLSLPLIDLRGLPENEREREALRQATELARQPFDLERGPLLRGCLVRVADRDHLAVLVMHHIVADGWSTGVLIRELASLYAAFSAGQPSPLPELPVQYADFAAWQRGWMSGPRFDAELKYWKEQLAGCDGRIQLPLDNPRPAVQTWNGGTVSAVLPEALAAGVKNLSRAEGVTLFMTLLAAFQALLGRYSGQEDIAVGTPVANRNRAELEPLIGFFVNTLVLRTQLGGNPTFRELLQRVRETASGAFAHQDMPFERLVEALEPERDLSTSPLFEVMFVLQNAPFKPLELPGLKVTRMELDTGAAKLDLVLTAAERGGTVSLTLEYNADLFHQSTARRLLDHYINLLRGAAAQPGQPIGRIPLLSDEERRQIIGWNAAIALPPGDSTIHEWIERQAAARPDAPAVVFEERQLSYGELDARANRLAARLGAMGVKPEVLVAVCLDRSFDAIVSVLGVLKAGGAYLPLDPGYPAGRLAYMLEDSGAGVLITHSALRDRLPNYTGRILWIDEPLPETAPPPACRASADNLAYVIYTSGTTGRPKGVLVPHRGLCNLVQGQISKFRVEPGSRVLQFASLSFDASVSEIFVTLAAGATLYLARTDILTSPADLLHLMREAAISVVTLPPSLLSVLPSEDLPALKTLVSAGEACTPELAARWAQGRRFVNGYGPTETTVGPTFHVLDTAPEQIRKVPIGRPIPNTQVYLLDRDLEPVPIGVAGEIYVGGVGLARGYLNRPDLTAESFVPSPFGPGPGARLYRTGDLGRYLPDGEIEYVGRADNQVKVRGYRIELGEVEAALRECAGVAQAAVVVRQDAPGVRRLAAYFVARDPAPTPQELRAHLSARLPDFMTPATFTRLEALPMTPNGKVDRSALPAPEAAAGEQPAYVEPRTAEERTLAGIWQQVLGLERVGVEDNFFELGGDSILSIQVIARAREAGLQFTPKQLFQNPTIAKLAALGGGKAVAAEQGAVEGPVPATPIQRWFLEQDLPEAHHWNQAVLLKVTQPLDEERLRRAVRTLIAHHDALRLRLTDDGLRNAAPTGEAPVEWIDASGVPEREQEAFLVRRAAGLQASLNLRTGPLIRVAYFEMGPGRPARLLIVIHHLCVDGVSWRILLEDFQRAYEGLPLPAKTTSYREWARRLTELAHSERLQQELRYWIELNSGAAAALPLDHSDGENTEASVDHVAISFDPSETEALVRGMPAAFGAEIHEALLSALGAALCEWTGSPSVLVDVEGHGREPIFDDVDVSRTVGWFTSLFPVRLGAGRPASVVEMLRAVRDELRQMPNRGLGYGVLRYMDGQGSSRQLRELPQPQVSFNYLGQFDQLLPPDAPLKPAGESAGPVHSPQARRSHLLEISGGISGGCLRLDWMYSREVHERATIERLAGAFGERLRELIAAVRNAQTRPGADAGLSDADLDVLMDELS